MNFFYKLKANLRVDYDATLLMDLDYIKLLKIPKVNGIIIERKNRDRWRNSNLMGYSSKVANSSDKQPLDYQGMYQLMRK